MRPQFIMGMVFIWLLLSACGLMMGGIWFTAGDQQMSIMQYLTGYSSFTAAGLFGIVAIPVNFLVSLFKLATFDYPFLTGGLGGFVRLLLTGVFGIAFVYAVSGDFRYSISGMFGRR